jgi:hypothetical protein
LRLALDSAAAMHIQDARRPLWTDGEYSVAKVAPLVDVGNGTLTLETTAYSARSDCIRIPESKYHKTILTPGETGIRALSIQITADDRGCRISDFTNLRLDPDHPNTVPRIWPTTSWRCRRGLESLQHCNGPVRGRTHQRDTISSHADLPTGLPRARWSQHPAP